MNCQGMRIGEAKGLGQPAPNGKGTPKQWLVERGTME